MSPTPWQRLDDALSRYAPAVLGALRPPLAEPALLEGVESSRLELLGLLAAWRAHDGARRAGTLLSRLPASGTSAWATSATWLEARRVREEYARLPSLGAREGAEPLVPVGRVGRYSATYAREGELQCVVAAGLRTGALWAVSYAGNEVEAAPLGLTWMEYVTELQRALEAGELENQVDSFGVLRLVPRSAPPPTPPRTRTDGEALGLLLLERRCVALAGEPSARWFAKLDKAYRKRSPAARLEALREALEGDEVEDYFASDEELAGLLALLRGE